MDRKKLMILLKREEGTKLDFKQKLELYYETGKKELAKDICAIANSKGGRGYILVGVEDKSKEFVGIDSINKFTEEQIQQIISSRCDPPIPISVDWFDIDGKDIASITIYDGQQKPYQIRENGAFYIRRGSTTDIMRKQELVASFEENLSLSIEACGIMRSHISALNIELVKRYFDSKGVTLTEENKNFLLETSSIAFVEKETGNMKCTLGGLLVFSDINSVYIPHNMIRITNKFKNGMNEIKIIQGNVLKMIDEAETFLKNLLPSVYPVEAVMEAVKNAVLYRDYSDFTKVIEIFITNNSISIISPGQLIKSNRKGRENFGYGRRNMWLYEKVVTLDDKKRFLKSSGGFYKMKKAFKHKGKVLFVNSRAEDAFKVIFPGVSRFLDEGQ
ncbi:ATP-binding protein [Clostridium polyendosporum]|uniref:ATP-binding protein n=1 Tax=Clostridium polyendosporum TaxID=69208 RepID=A0A919VH97_9CLOT|nr:RNA-binding domain-containing protein [Clostridium polyendosporum]GIM29461.1 ATP-binding protein [Clostridium polyendosporum]